MTTTGLDVRTAAAEIVVGLRSLSNGKTATVRAFRRGYSERFSKESPQDLVGVAFLLLREPDFLCRFVAYELVAHHRAALQSLSAKELERFGQGIASWEAVDTFACYVSGPAWREKQVTDRLIHGWARSADRWWRRAALVSTVPLNNKARGGQGDPRRTLAVCRLLVSDSDDMVVKALSWALLELAKRDPQAVRAFLKEQKAVLAKRVLREVKNKLTTGLKNPRGK
ncbi:MAG TPA: DNA alkylation repair protein [Gemmataceae bacterium]|jgi:3-methyladenine DNA glycosylase AlkD